MSSCNDRSPTSAPRSDRLQQSPWRVRQACPRYCPATPRPRPSNGLFTRTEASGHRPGPPPCRRSPEGADSPGSLHGGQHHAGLNPALGLRTWLPRPDGAGARPIPAPAPVDVCLPVHACNGTRVAGAPPLPSATSSLRDRPVQSSYCLPATGVPFDRAALVPALGGPACPFPGWRCNDWVRVF